MRRKKKWNGRKHKNAMQFQCSVPTVRTWQLYVGSVVCSNTDGDSWGEVISFSGWICPSGDRNTEMGNEFGIYSVNEGIQGAKQVWCEQLFVKFNSFFQVAIFHVTLGYRMDVSGVPSAAGTRDFSKFLKHSEWVPPHQGVLTVLVLRVKRPRLEGDHLLAVSSEV